MSSSENQLGLQNQTISPCPSILEKEGPKKTGLLGLVWKIWAGSFVALNFS